MKSFTAALAGKCKSFTVKFKEIMLTSDSQFGYLRKWLFISGLIGVVAGVGAIFFYSAIKWSTFLFLGMGAGYFPPKPAGEGGPVVTPILHVWMIPVITTLGGLLSGLLVYNLAPEAEGHGTDAAIDAFHHKEGKIRARVPLVKILASAITIGSGGSAGREGPTAQIAAGFGSILGQLLGLSVRDRRIALACGIGAGIGAIFKAPLGGAILSAELLYLEGFESEVLIPSIIASVIGYVIFCLWKGNTPIFGWYLGAGMKFQPADLLYFALLGVLCGLVGLLYPKTFYWVHDRFKALGLPKWLKPAIGGLLVGIMGMFLPQIMEMGYGWLQLAMMGSSLLPLYLIAIIIFAKILATSLSIGSGGSGGVFAPGLVIGGMVGSFLYGLLTRAGVHLSQKPEIFVLVGMIALFGAVARAPLAVMFMVCEMAGNYVIFVPAMVAVSIAYIILGKNTIYRSQVPAPQDSPAHMHEYSRPKPQKPAGMVENVDAAVGTGEM